MLRFLTLILLIVCTSSSSLRPDCVGSDNSYDGVVDRTRSGTLCQRWDVTTPHLPKVKPKDGGHHNYCRNPDGDLQGPWCYTTDPTKKWEYCSIIRCLITTTETYQPESEESETTSPPGTTTTESFQYDGYEYNDDGEYFHTNYNEDVEVTTTAETNQPETTSLPKTTTDSYLNMDDDVVVDDDAPINNDDDNDNNNISSDGSEGQETYWNDSNDDADWEYGNGDYYGDTTTSSSYTTTKTKDFWGSLLGGEYDDGISDDVEPTTTSTTTEQNFFKTTTNPYDDEAKALPENNYYGETDETDGAMEGIYGITTTTKYNFFTTTTYAYDDGLEEADVETEDKAETANNYVQDLLDDYKTEYNVFTTTTTYPYINDDYVDDDNIDEDDSNYENNPQGLGSGAIAGLTILGLFLFCFLPLIIVRIRARRHMTQMRVQQCHNRKVHVTMVPFVVRVYRLYLSKIGDKLEDEPLVGESYKSEGYAVPV